MLTVGAVKFLVQTVASVSAAKVVGDVIANNTAAATTIEKIMVKTGSLVLGSMVMDAANKHVNEVWNSVLGNVQVEVKRLDSEPESRIEDKGPE